MTGTPAPGAFDFAKKRKCDAALAKVYAAYTAYTEAPGPSKEYAAARFVLFDLRVAKEEAFRKLEQCIIDRNTDEMIARMKARPAPTSGEGVRTVAEKKMLQEAYENAVAKLIRAEAEYALINAAEADARARSKKLYAAFSAARAEFEEAFRECYHTRPGREMFDAEPQRWD